MSKYDVFKVRDLGPRKDMPFLNNFERKKVGSVEADMVDREEKLKPFRNKYQKGRWGIEIEQR